MCIRTPTTMGTIMGIVTTMIRITITAIPMTTDTSTLMVINMTMSSTIIMRPHRHSGG